MQAIVRAITDINGPHGFLLSRRSERIRDHLKAGLYCLIFNFFSDILLKDLTLALS